MCKRSAPCEIQRMSALSRSLIDLASSLAENLEEDVIKGGRSASNSLSSSTISPMVIYQSTLLLHQYQYEQQKHQKQKEGSESLELLHKLFGEMLLSLPQTYLKNCIINPIHDAFLNLFEADDDDEEEKENALKSVTSLYCIPASMPYVCKTGFDRDVCITLAESYNTGYNDILDDCILRALSNLIMYGLLSDSKTEKRILSNEEYDIGLQDDDDDADEDVEDDVHLQYVMETIQLLNSYDESILGQLQIRMKEQTNKNSAKSPLLIDQIKSLFPHSTVQRTYLLQMLETAEQESSSKTLSKKKNKTLLLINKNKNKQNNNNKKKNKNNSSTLPSVDPIQVMIDRVRQVLPNYGEGYIEAALACYNGNVEQTISMILASESNSNESGIHPRLKLLDKSLPRSSSSTTVKQRKEEDATSDAKQIQKQFLKRWETEEEKTAFQMEQFFTVNSSSRGEYDDDVDDQYDNVQDAGGTINDMGTYDFEQVKTYNRLMKEEVADQEFWDQTKNQNRSNNKATITTKKKKKDKDGDDSASDSNEGGNDDNGEVKKKFGPDKGKGGRIIGPDGKYLPFKKKKKGKGNNNSNPNGINKDASAQGNQNEKKKNSNDAGANMTKIQKRRKNDNKAKIANHNRKQRATRKTGGI